MSFHFSLTFTVVPVCSDCFNADAFNNVMQFRHGGREAACIFCTKYTRILMPMENIIAQKFNELKTYDATRARTLRLEERLKKIDAEFEEKIKKMEHVDIKQQALEDMLTPVIAVMGNDSYAKMMEDVIAAKKEFLSTEEK